MGPSTRPFAANRELLGDEVVVLSGSPTRVRERIRVDLGTKRDRLTTKALPELAALRTQVLRLILGTTPADAAPR